MQNLAEDAELHPTTVAAPRACETVDPRVRRTREHLQRALAMLLQTQDFENLSVQEITDAAGVNRATFYAHYPDKYALLECMVAARFHALLDSRGVLFYGGCVNALRGFVLGVCNFLELSLAHPCAAQGRPMPPHMETAIIAVVCGMILSGMARHGAEDGSSPDDKLRAAAISWAIYGAAREWVKTPDRAPSEEIATTVVTLIAPLMGPAKGPSLERPASA